MSGLMRRIMRPSADDAGQPATQGEAAAPDAQGPIGEAGPGANPFAPPGAAADREPIAEEPPAVAPPAGSGPDAAAPPAAEDDRPAGDPATEAQPPAQRDEPIPETDRPPADPDATAVIPAVAPEDA